VPTSRPGESTGAGSLVDTGPASASSSNGRTAARPSLSRHPSRRRSSASPKRHTLICATCGRTFTARLREARFCSRDCRLESQAELAAARRALPPNPREAWPAEVDQLAGKLARIEEALDVERDRDRIPLLRRRLLATTAQLEQMKASLMAAEQPALAP
jgi:hypothetical protein